MFHSCSKSGVFLHKNNRCWYKINDSLWLLGLSLWERLYRLGLIPKRKTKIKKKSKFIIQGKNSLEMIEPIQNVQKCCFFNWFWFVVSVLKANWGKQNQNVALNVKCKRGFFFVIAVSKRNNVYSENCYNSNYCMWNELAYIIYNNIHLSTEIRMPKEHLLSFEWCCSYKSGNKMYICFINNNDVRRNKGWKSFWVMVCWEFN